MATTYTLIASQTLAATTTIVTFSSIPATYTDLVLCASMRGNTTGNFSSLGITFNNDSATNYSWTVLWGAGDGSVVSQRGSSDTRIYTTTAMPGNSGTANTFNSIEYYIPNYTLTQKKQISVFTSSEANATSTGREEIEAGLWQGTAAINRIDLTPNVGAPPPVESFVSGSTFYLYGIKNS